MDYLDRAFAKAKELYPAEYIDNTRPELPRRWLLVDAATESHDMSRRGLLVLQEWRDDDPYPRNHWGFMTPYPKGPNDATSTS